MRNRRPAPIVSDTATCRTRPNGGCERGFSLAELLVAMSITVVVTGAAFIALQEAGRSSESASVIADVNQNLRVAMNMLIRDLLQTGEGTRTGIPIPTGVGVLPIVRPGPAGSEWTFPSRYTVLPAVSPENGTGILVNGIATDVLTLFYEDRRLDMSGVFPTIAADGSSVTFPDGFAIDDPAIGIKPGDLIRFGEGAMQEVTSVSGQTVYFDDTAESGLNQRSAPGGSVMALQTGGVWPPLEMHRIYMVTYYLMVPTSGPITSPHFIRRVNYGEERAIAIGIENIQLTWDLVDGVTNPTYVSDFNDETLEGQIRKANIYMAGRSLAETGRNQVVRTSLSTQVSLRSMSFVSRYDLQ